MKKISLKNILKKTFKKEVSKKKKKKQTPSKVKKNLKPNKVIKKTQTNKKKLLPKKKVITKEVQKTDNLRIAKSNEVKPEIKKIKKQQTEKKLFKPKDYVVYPKHGVGQILSVNSKMIGGIDVQCYDIKF